MRGLSSYDIVIVGSGFFGCVIAERIASDFDLPVLIVEKRNHIGGNCHSQRDRDTDIEYHTYGTHIFHTSDKNVIRYITRFTEFNNYNHTVWSMYRRNMYSMPVNLQTINKFYNDTFTPEEAKNKIIEEISKESTHLLCRDTFESTAIQRVGRPLYEALIKGYTKKQWQMDIDKLPSNIVKRLPVRYSYDNNYFYDGWQGIPLKGYTNVFYRLTDSDKINIAFETNFFDIKKSLNETALIIYSGPIDRYFDYKLGRLKYRTIRLEKERLHIPDYQGTSVVNYADEFIPYTRIHEPKHLHKEREWNSSETIIFKEYSEPGDFSDQYYPVGDEESKKIFNGYLEMADKEERTVFGGRLADYKYYDMDKTIARALEVYELNIRHKIVSLGLAGRS